MYLQKYFIVKSWIVQKVSMWILSKGQIRSKGRLASRRFSQKTNGRIWFVCREDKKSKENKFVRLVFGRNQETINCFRDQLTFSITKRPSVLYLQISFETHCIVCFGNSPNYNTSCVLGEQYLISKWTNGSKQRNSRINFKSNKTTAKLTRSF